MNTISMVWELCYSITIPESWNFEKYLAINLKRKLFKTWLTDINSHFFNATAMNYDDNIYH